MKKQYRILVVDDNAATRYALNKVLTLNGFLVEEAATGFEGLKRAQDLPDLIVLDVQLPDIDGYEVCKKIKETSRTAGIPVLQVSAAFTTTQAHAKGLEVGADAYLVHPVAPEVLDATIKALLRMKLAEKQLNESREALQEAKENAEAANLAKSLFLANMSHEIRTPLGAIIGFTELMIEQELTETERHEYLDTVRRNGTLLLQLIGDILDLSKIESGKLTTEILACDLNGVLKDVSDLLEPQAREKGILLSIEVGPGVPEVVFTDVTRLKQILINLIGNAIKFTEKGEVSVSVMGYDRNNSDQIEIGFVIEDSGAGISPAQQTKLFQAFSQADESTTRMFGGTGLGLLLARKLARALGGDVVLAESQPGLGSTFFATISTPRSIHLMASGLLQRRSVKEEKAPDTRTHIERCGALNGLRILVVDDAPDNKLLISRFLQNDGALVVTASDGIEGVDLAMSADFDLVLMDMQMPKRDGFEATRELRRLGYVKPILALTAAALTEERDRTLAAGCDAHLTKPIDRRAMIKIISELC